MTTFGERLKELRNTKQLTQKEFSKVVGITERAYQNYEINASFPSFKTLIFLADYFKVSLDYLIGRSDNSKIQ